MKAYRDLRKDGAHSVCLDTGVLLRFDAAGVLRDPTEAEEASMTRDAMRRQRFEPVNLDEGEAPQPPAAGAATGDDGQGDRGRRRRRNQSLPEPAAEVAPAQSPVDERVDVAVADEPAAEVNRDDK